MFPEILSQMRVEVASRGRIGRPTNETTLEAPAPPTDTAERRGTIDEVSTLPSALVSLVAQAVYVLGLILMEFSDE